MAVCFIFMFSLILSSAAYAAVQDFCVADYLAPSGPAGYSCRKPEVVTVNDFVYHGLGVPTNTATIFKAANAFASAANFPGLNGLGISMSRVDLAPGGAIPLHTHPAATELIHVTQGTLVAGFITSDRNTVYVTTIKTGDIMVFPRGLLHFQVNIGNGTAIAFASYNNQRPSLQVVDFALFQNNFSTNLIANTTLLTIPEIRRLKALLGGTN